MKDGKPEVLIIGEAHPWYYYQLLRETKLRDFKAAEKKVEDVQKPAHIIENEIKSIKKFGAQRILFEGPITKENQKICTNLLETKNLSKFREGLFNAAEVFWQKVLDAADKICTKDIGAKYMDFGRQPQYRSKIISFLIGSTNVYDFNFFVDPDLAEKCLVYKRVYEAACITVSFIPLNSSKKKRITELATEYKKLIDKYEAERENSMARNIKKLIIDKTVIICGAYHIPAIENGLKDVAYLHQSIDLSKG